jgi:hypothetical protein
VNRYNIFNHTNISNNVWVHNPAHRGNVPYRNAAVAERFGRSNEAAARDAMRERVDVQRDDIFKDRPDVPRDRPDAQRDDAFRSMEGKMDDAVRKDDADRRISPAVTERRDDDVRKDDADRRIDRPMRERRDAAPERQDARRDFMQSRAQAFRPERRPMGGGFHFHGGGRDRL